MSQSMNSARRAATKKQLAQKPTADANKLEVFDQNW
jgi:hypothetical protein